VSHLEIQAKYKGLNRSGKRYNWFVFQRPWPASQINHHPQASRSRDRGPPLTSGKCSPTVTPAPARRTPLWPPGHERAFLEALTASFTTWIRGQFRGPLSPIPKPVCPSFLLPVRLSFFRVGFWRGSVDYPR